MRDFTRSGKVPSARRLAAYHLYLRRDHSSRLFWLFYFLIGPVCILVFRIRRKGKGFIPAKGRAVLAANHCSFTDPFFLALLRRRRLYFIAKAELFSNPVLGWIFVRLGAIPILRASNDEEALQTARELLFKGQIVGIFPEGTRTREQASRPRQGAARLALDTDSPLIPCGVNGTETASELRFGHRIGISARAPMLPVGDSAELTGQLWKQIQLAKVDAAIGKSP